MSERITTFANKIIPVCKLVRGTFGMPTVRLSRSTVNEDKLFINQIQWLTTNQQAEMEKILAKNGGGEQFLAKIIDYYESLNSTSQEKASGELKQYCQDRIKKLFGADGFELLKNSYEESASVELLKTKFTQLVGHLISEKQRTEAEQLRIFCRKVYNVEQFDSNELTTWLTNDQKLELARLIQDPDVRDDAVYARIFEFYENADDEKKTDARRIIESGCKRFLNRMFGDEIAAKLEDHKVNGNYTSQMLSAELSMYVAEIKDEKNRLKAEKSIPICNHIYFGYKGDCFCNGHSSICGPFTHQCLYCADNTFGVQCEKCLDGFEGSALQGKEGCVLSRKNVIQFVACFCNGHFSECDENGKCLHCLHNTTGNQCENCAEGFYGDATQGTAEDCIKCPCPDDGDCFINDDALVECRKCPHGTYGTTCEFKLNHSESATKIIQMAI